MKTPEQRSRNRKNTDLAQALGKMTNPEKRDVLPSLPGLSHRGRQDPVDPVNPVKKTKRQTGSTGFTGSMVMT